MAGFGIDDAEMQCRLCLIQRWVGKACPKEDPEPAHFSAHLLVGSRHHASDVGKLVKMGVTALLNCAPSGVKKLPIDEFEERGIQYRFTNVRRDDSEYPVLHDRDGLRSTHLRTAKAFFDEVQARKERIMFFCVAGQNRSATLAIAVLMLSGQPLEDVLERCSQCRPFVLENEGFQRQLVELEALMRHNRIDKMLQTPSTGLYSLDKRRKPSSGCYLGEYDESPLPLKRLRSQQGIFDQWGENRGYVIAELHVPGTYRVFEVPIPGKAPIWRVKEMLVERVESYCSSDSPMVKVGKSWLVYLDESVHGAPIDLVLEEEALEIGVQLLRLKEGCGLAVEGGDEDALVHWEPRPVFELVIFSTIELPMQANQEPVHRPFTFNHHERQGAPGTLLSKNVTDTHLRAWDFSSGEGHQSQTPIVFSYARNPRNKRDFVDVSTSAADEFQSYHSPSEGLNGEVLGMGANAIVQRVQLVPSASSETDCAEGLPARANSGQSIRRSMTDLLQGPREWDAAVKRNWNLPKMLAFMANRSEAGVAKRLRLAGALNRHGRLLYFYGLGVAVSSNVDNRDEYRFEVALLSRYHAEFSTYTLKKFLEDYTAKPVADAADPRQQQMQQGFTLIKVKVLLVSLLNGFRDLTLMGIPAFDFNHLNNVLISRDYKKCRLIDIDGESRGSIQFPSEYIEGTSSSTDGLHQPALDIDLSLLLPQIVWRLIFGKGRGCGFVEEKIGKVRRARCDEEAKLIIQNVVRENFFPDLPANLPEPATKSSRHLLKVVEWFHAVVTKRRPWTSWTNDIYDAMRCIDHLPIH